AIGDGRPDTIIDERSDVAGGGDPDGSAGGAGVLPRGNDGSDLLELPPIVTVLRARGRGEVTVRLEVHITELGALEIACVEAGATPETWKLAFDMRSGGSATADPVPDAHPRIDEAKARIQRAFQTGDG